MWIAIGSFVVVFLLIASFGMLVFYREAMLQRIAEVINPAAAKKPKSLLETIQQTGISIGGVVEHFEQVLPKSQAEVSIVRQRLIRAGYRRDTAINVFYGSKVLTPLLACALAWVTGLVSLGPLFVIVLSLCLGFMVPDFWLGRQIKKRQKRIRLGLPDVLDLLIICVEAGLSLDQATARTASELKQAQPELCDELSVVVLEQRAGRARAESWRNMADRTDVDSVRNLVTMLIQSEQLGTSIARTLRIHGDTLRTQRVQAVEEAAAKLTVKLLFPLVFFIFPSLFIVILGPAMISVMATFKSMR
ncbi:MAG: type II secretion system F family protein [Terracidiphilus sp.]|jgi:tight adherence protein C